MIIEHEILEQLLDDDWQLSRVVVFLNELGADPWQIVVNHLQEGNIIFLNPDGSFLPDWEVQEIVRVRNASAKAMVHCTNKGAEVVS